MPATYNGYQANFLADSGMDVCMPALSSYDVTKLARIDSDPDDYIIKYQNYSVIQHIERKFPLVTACNISGPLFIKIDRKEVGDNWDKEDRIQKDYQWGQELYDAEMSDFDRGHMTKREDVQWGHDKAQAMDAARSTYFFTNAVPQHARLNRGVWKSLEHYILKTETLKNQDKICLFTGPVLAQDDPTFVTLVDGQEVQLPVLFWKVVYFINRQSQLSRVAFLTNQRQILEKKGITKPVVHSRSTERSAKYMNYKNADIYQCKVDTIEELTDMKFAPAIDSYQDDRPTRLIIREVNVRKVNGELEKNENDFPVITINNIIL